jgi:hypothetical protein
MYYKIIEIFGKIIMFSKINGKNLYHIKKKTFNFLDTFLGIS